MQPLPLEHHGVFKENMLMKPGRGIRPIELTNTLDPLILKSSVCTA
jgi:hypothetical protein